jgi:hypothetical protein
VLSQAMGSGGGTQPFVPACTRCFVYREEPLPGEERFITRVAAAVSVLEPFDVVYVTTQIWRSTYPPSSRPELAFALPSAFKPAADTLARLIEQVLGYRRFPLEFARVPLPDLRVGFFNYHGEPRLLKSLSRVLPRGLEAAGGGRYERPQHRGRDPHARETPAPGREDGQEEDLGEEGRRRGEEGWRPEEGPSPAQALGALSPPWASAGPWPPGPA